MHLEEQRVQQGPLVGEDGDAAQACAENDT
jgi:hypothetical protein